MTAADWIIIAILASIIIADIVLVVRKQKTISNRLRMIGQGCAVVPFSWGVLAGHFWGPHCQPVFGSYWISIQVLLVACVFVALLHAALDKYAELPNWISLVYVTMGLSAGVFFWPQ